jgi:hypothetical protein
MTAYRMIAWVGTIARAFQLNREVPRQLAQSCELSGQSVNRQTANCARAAKVAAAAAINVNDFEFIQQL